MKGENFYFGPQARWRSAAKSLGISESDLNSFPKSAPGMVGDSSYTFKSPMKYKSGGKVREIEVEIKIPRMSKKSEMRSCGKPMKKAMGGEVSQPMDDAGSYKKGGIARKSILMNMMKNHSKPSMKMASPKASCSMSLKKMPSMSKKSFNMPNHPFKFLRDK